MRNQRAGFLGLTRQGLILGLVLLGGTQLWASEEARDLVFRLNDHRQSQEVTALVMALPAEEAIDALTFQLNGPAPGFTNESTRHDALLILAQLRDPSGILPDPVQRALLLDALADRSPRVRKIALHSLAHFPASEQQTVSDQLIALYDLPQWADERTVILDTLAKCCGSSPRVAEFLREKLLAEPDDTPLVPNLVAAMLACPGDMPVSETMARCHGLKLALMIAYHLDPVSFAIMSGDTSKLTVEERREAFELMARALSELSVPTKEDQNYLWYHLASMMVQLADEKELTAPGMDSRLKTMRDHLRRDPEFGVKLADMIDVAFAQMIPSALGTATSPIQIPAPGKQQNAFGPFLSGSMKHAHAPAPGAAVVERHFVIKDIRPGDGGYSITVSATEAFTLQLGEVSSKTRRAVASSPRGEGSHKHLVEATITNPGSPHAAFAITAGRSCEYFLGVELAQPETATTDE